MNFVTCCKKLFCFFFISFQACLLDIRPWKNETKFFFCERVFFMSLEMLSKNLKNIHLSTHCITLCKINLKFSSERKWKKNLFCVIFWNHNLQERKREKFMFIRWTKKQGFDASRFNSSTCRTQCRSVELEQEPIESSSLWDTFPRCSTYIKNFPETVFLRKIRKNQKVMKSFVKNKLTWSHRTLYLSLFF